MRHGGALLMVLAGLGCTGEPEPEPSSGGEQTQPVVQEAEQAVVEEAQAPVAVEPLAPDPHPVVAGYARELRAWLTEGEAEGLAAIELTGTANGETPKLTELIRHVLFRELAGTAIVRLPVPEIERYGEDIRAMPESPAGDGEDFGGHGEGPHMNVDSMGNVVAELQSVCDSRLSEEQQERRPNRCDERFAAVWAAVKLARMAYGHIDVVAMGFVDPGTPMGDGEWDRAEPIRLRELFALAERAGLDREWIAGVGSRLLRELVALAREGSE